MKATFILSNYTPEFYNKISVMSPTAQWLYLKKVMIIQPKIGDNNTIAECVKFNIEFKKANEVFGQSVMLVRKGYRLLILSI